MEKLVFHSTMKIGGIYYTDNRLDSKMLKVCQKQLRVAFDREIVSCSLKSMDFGKNIVFNGVNICRQPFRSKERGTGQIL